VRPSPTVWSLVVALLILSAVFWLIERWRPSGRTVRRRSIDTRTDVVYWFFSPIVTRGVTRVALAAAFAALAISQGLTFDELRRLAESRRTWVSSLPLAAQAPILLLAADLIGYWTHRWFHGRWLWRFHAIHHSSVAVDWLSSVRLHPVNDVVTRVCQLLPLYFLGFSGPALAGLVPVLTLYTLFLHANVPWAYGPLRFVIASPVFHRWHHTTETEGLDRNFAGMFPFIDVVFGTFYIPSDRLPARFGIAGDHVPDGLIAQLVYPFTRR
jgi:sterol desaturase/sphingolipid hydroxylase (fatty acid hydroxylase superfamily)